MLNFSQVNSTNSKSVEKVILVNELDEELGVMEKMQAHSLGLLHRAFSVFIFNEKNELLIQQRAKSKYHSGGLWSNTCCSHPGQGESIVNSAERRLMEEMGFTTKLNKVFDFIYRKKLDKGRLNINKEEVEDYKYIGTKDLQLDIAEYPRLYTEWFKISLPQVLSNL